MVLWEGIHMKARNNPTPSQILRRLRRHPESDHDPRYEKDGYWALRRQGYPHSYAKRAFRDQPPELTQRKATAVTDCDPEDILFPPGSRITTVHVAIRPLLTEDAIANAQPRSSEYTIWDEAIGGFGLRVRPSGHKSFVLYCRHRGETKLRKITFGRAGSLTLEAARGMAREFLYKARDPARLFTASVSTPGTEAE
jgi:hypothetical protein